MMNGYDYWSNIEGYAKVNPLFDRLFKKLQQAKQWHEQAARYGGASKEIRSARIAIAKFKGTHTPEEWAEIVEQFNGCCARCGKPEFTKDHIVPIYMGGCECIANLQPLCRNCNSSKGPECIDWRVR